MQIQAYILNIQPKTRENKIYLYCKRQDGKRQVIIDDFFPFFYVQTNNELLLSSMNSIIKYERVQKKRLGKNITIFKVYTKFENFRSTIDYLKKNSLLVFNSDLSFVKQYILSKGISANTLYIFSGEMVRLGRNTFLKVESMQPVDESYEPVSLFLDIISSASSPNNPEANPVEAIAFGKSLDEMNIITWREDSELPQKLFYDTTNVIRVDSESALLREFSEIWERIDIPVFLNDDLFDSRFLLRRCRKYNIFIKNEGKNEVNVSSYIKMRELDYKHLDETHPLQLANELMGNDVENIRTILIECSKLTGLPCSIITDMSFAQMMEWMLIKEMNDRGELIPERKVPEQFMRRKIVNLPEEKIYPNLWIMDVRLVNTKTIMDKNLSPELVNCDCCETEICTKKQGIFSSMLDSMYSRFMRVSEMTKTQHQSALTIRKIILEKLLQTAYPFFISVLNRWYSKYIDNIVFSQNTEVFKEISNLLREKDCPIVYNDEDHILFQNNKHQDIAAFLRDEIRENIILNDFENSIIIDQEEFFIRKMAAIKKEKVFIYGLTTTSVPDIILQSRILLLRHVLKNEFDEAQKLIDIFKQRIASKDLPASELLIKETAHKKVQDYESKIPFVKALTLARQKGFYTKTIYYLIKPGDENISDRVALPEDTEEYDPNFYINNHLLPFSEKLFLRAGIKAGIKPQGKP